jgi:hypothetical protein
MAAVKKVLVRFMFRVKERGSKRAAGRGTKGNIPMIGIRRLGSFGGAAKDFTPITAKLPAILPYGIF